MKGLLFVAVVNMVLFYIFWGKWDILALICGAFFFAYKRYLVDYADRLLK